MLIHDMHCIELEPYIYNIAAGKVIEISALKKETNRASFMYIYVHKRHLCTGLFLVHKSRC